MKERLEHVFLILVAVLMTTAAQSSAVAQELRLIGLKGDTATAHDIVCRKIREDGVKKISWGELTQYSAPALVAYNPTCRMAAIRYDRGPDAETYYFTVDALQVEPSTTWSELIAPSVDKSKVRCLGRTVVSVQPRGKKTAGLKGFDNLC